MDLKSNRVRGWGAVVAGFVLFNLGNSLLGAADFGSHSTPAEYGEKALSIGSDARNDVLRYVLLVTPGYLLLFCGIGMLLRNWRRNDSVWLTRTATAMMAVAALSAVIDIAGTLLRLLGLGGVDLDADPATGVVAPPQWLVDTEAFALTVGGFVTMGLMLLLLINLVSALVRRVVNR